LQDILTTAANANRAKRIAEMRRIRAMSPPLPPGAPLAEKLIRADRNSR
jgi:hypothetical protein